MCGICGYLDFNPAEQVDKKVLHKMCDALAHRGPDDWGVYADENFGMSMRRLSIIDLETGHQPIHNEDSSKWIVSNGEIYNFLELRQDLIKRGHRFYTRSDTE